MIAALFARFGLQAGIVAGLIVTAVMWRTADVHHQRAVGAEKAVAKIEKATDNAAKLGKRAADKSTSGGVLGQRDPTTRDD